MPTYEIPTHLHVSDRVIAGLTWHQLLVLGAGLACAFWLWRTVPLRGTPGAGLPAAPLVAALACALVRLDGHDLLTWLALVAVYALTPHRLVWRREPASVLPGSAGPERRPADLPVARAAVGTRRARFAGATACRAGLLALRAMRRPGTPLSESAGPLPAARGSGGSGAPRGRWWWRAVSPLLDGRLLCLSMHHQRHLAPEQAL